jgi:hypothetical protein
MLWFEYLHPATQYSLFGWIFEQSRSNSGFNVKNA